MDPSRQIQTPYQFQVADLIAPPAELLPLRVEQASKAASELQSAAALASDLRSRSTWRQQEASYGGRPPSITIATAVTAKGLRG